MVEKVLAILELRKRPLANDLQELEMFLSALERLLHRDHAVSKHACLWHQVSIAGLDSLSNHESGILEDLSRDDEAVDLAGPFVDLGDARVAEVALDRILLGVAVSSVDLQSPSRPSLRHL